MVRNGIAIVVGLLVGGIVNMALITAGPVVIAPPAGVDLTTAGGLQAGMALLQPRHFVFPFLAHAFGTLVGAAIAARVGGSRQPHLALVIGGVFLLGGFMAARMIPAPTWFIVLDLVVAYIPMAWLGGRIGLRER